MTSEELERAMNALVDCNCDVCKDRVIDAIRSHLATPQQESKPDQWAPYLKEGETPFERFMRERADLDALMTLYRNVLAQQERKPHTEAEVNEILGNCRTWLNDLEPIVRRILGVPAP